VSLKVSIVTVTYNCSTVIDDCLASISSQSGVNIEHIVIDGESTDGTLGRLDAHRDRLAVIVSEPDNGIYDAMNKGLARSTGDIVGFLNSDDFYSHDRVLATVAECFERDPSLDACYSDLVYVKQFEPSRTVRFWQSAPFRLESFSRGWCPPHPTFFVRRSVYERFGGFDLNYRIAADFELMLRLLEVHRIRVEYVPEVWVKMRMGGTTNNSLRNVWVQNKESIQALHSYGHFVNPAYFFAHKFWARGLQFMRRPAH
jgi:glycosyltransferase involved in cell wall biosynthesis